MLVCARAGALFGWAAELGERGCATLVYRVAALYAAGGRILHFGPVAQVLEGDETPLPLAGVFEFPTLEQALNFYNSETYAPIKAERRDAQQARMFVVDIG